MEQGAFNRGSFFLACRIEDIQAAAGYNNQTMRTRKQEIVAYETCAHGCVAAGRTDVVVPLELENNVPTYRQSQQRTEGVPVYELSHYSNNLGGTGDLHDEE
uniref:Uncharacterized protein n=1 Tax=Romanomermis culicivorax TaxID=13658 RepID=A0A915HJM5_ROMCU